MNRLEEKEPVQAILIGDGFNDCFIPFTDRKPLVSLPRSFYLSPVAEVLRKVIVYNNFIFRKV